MSRLSEIENEIDRLIAAQSDWTPLVRKLAAEVDAVKAKSIMALNDGEPCRLDTCGLRYFIHDSDPRPCVRLHSINDDTQWLIETLGEIQRSWWHANTIVQPVRLEQWEETK